MEKRLQEFLDLLNSEDESTAGTSVRLPVTLRSAAAIAADLGLGESTTELTVRGLRNLLEAFAMEAALAAHFQAHPDARPTLTEMAMVTAEMDGNPLADRPDLIHRAATELVAIKDDPAPDDVLLYAAGLASGLAEEAA